MPSQTSMPSMMSSPHSATPVDDDSLELLVAPELDSFAPLLDVSKAAVVLVVVVSDALLVCVDPSLLESAADVSSPRQPATSAAETSEIRAWARSVMRRA